MEKSQLRRPAPTSVNVTVGRRSREYLTEREVERLIEAAKQNRCGHRDATAILVAYRHGLRASEIVALRWDDIDLARRGASPCRQPARVRWGHGQSLRNYAR
jgi:integrase